MPIIISGTFITNTVAPIGSAGINRFSTCAIPVKPPIARLLLSKKQLNAKEYSKHPNVIIA
jgi:hypothetical protein